jgi:hypothetical protein
MVEFLALLYRKQHAKLVHNLLLLEFSDNAMIHYAVTLKLNLVHSFYFACITKTTIVRNSFA